MKLSNIEIGDIIITKYSKPQSGIAGHAYIHLYNEKFLHVASIDAYEDWHEMLSNFSYVWDQLTTSHSIEKGTVEKVTKRKLHIAVMKIFEPTRVK